MAISMLPPVATRIATLLLRIMTAIVLFVSFMMLVTYTPDVIKVIGKRELGKKKWHFYERTGFQYMAATTGLGILFSIYGTVVVALRIKRGNDEGNLLIDFYGQKVLSNLLVSTAVAGFLTVQSMQKELDNTGWSTAPYEKFWSMHKTISGLVLLAFFFSFALSILSSHTLARRKD